MSLSDEFNPHNSEDFVPGVPNRAKRSKDRPVPRAADRDEIDARMRQIADDIVARDRVRYPREREQARRRAGQ